MDDFGVDGERIHRGVLIHGKRHIRESVAAFYIKSDRTDEKENRTSDEGGAQDHGQKLENVQNRRHKSDQAAAVYENNDGGKQIGQPDQIKKGYAELEKYIHGTQQISVKVSVKDAAVHIPCLHEQEHGNAVADNSDTVQKDNLFVGPTAEAAKAPYRRPRRQQNHDKLNRIAKEPADQKRRIFHLPLNFEPDTQQGHAEVISDVFNGIFQGCTPFFSDKVFEITISRPG